MTTELTELRRDRKRLEWLMKCRGVSIIGGGGGCWLQFPDHWQNGIFTTPRAAIDAQMAKERKEKRK